MDKIEYKNYTVNIQPSDYVEDPRNWDCLSKLVLFHRRYNLAKEIDIDWEDYSGWEEMEKGIKKLYGRDLLLCLPISMHDHSGLHIYQGSPTCPWDSGRIGFQVILKSDVRKFFRVKRIGSEIRNRMLKIIEDEISVYSSYVNGEVYDYLIEDKKGNLIDSCGGYLGWNFEKNGLLEDAKTYIDNLE